MPPVRDEESETQRKAHAKRVRETRRSTQGVTLDEIKSAEQLVKQKNHNNNNNNTIGNHAEVNIEENNEDYVFATNISDVDVTESSTFFENSIEYVGDVKNSLNNGICKKIRNRTNVLSIENYPKVNIFDNSVDNPLKPLAIINLNNNCGNENNISEFIDKINITDAIDKSESSNFAIKRYLELLNIFNINPVFYDIMQYLTHLCFAKI